MTFHYGMAPLRSKTPTWQRKFDYIRTLSTRIRIRTITLRHCTILLKSRSIQQEGVFAPLAYLYIRTHLEQVPSSLGSKYCWTHVFIVLNVLNVLTCR